MSDKEKEEFTFDENDDFPETDLSGIFADSEEEAGSEREDAVESAPPEPETAEDFGLNDDVEPPPPVDEDPLAATKGGGSRTRILLLILLLVMVGAAGLYYMRLPDESPFETEVVPTSQQVVAVPPPRQEAKPAMADRQVAGEQAAAAAAGEEAPAEPAADQSADASAAMSTETSAGPPGTGGEVTPAEGPAGTEAPAVPSETAADEVRPGDAAPTASPAEQAQVQADAETPAPQPAPAAVVYQLDAGAFLFPAQRDEVKNKISALGYEPEETEVKASVRLIRLRVDDFPEHEIAAQLAEVRRIAPDAFSMLKDGQQVIYAGAFANQDNVQRLSARLREAGFQVSEEPVKVEKVLSRIRFGSFADDEAAEAAAQQAEDAGIPARVVGQ